MERKFLKSILGVKGNIPDHLLYSELNRPTILPLTKQHQKSFFDRLISLNDDDAIARQIVSRCYILSACLFYRNLDQNIIKHNIERMSVIYTILFLKVSYLACSSSLRVDSFVFINFLCNLSLLLIDLMIPGVIHGLAWNLKS